MNWNFILLKKKKRKGKLKNPILWNNEKPINRTEMVLYMYSRCEHVRQEKQLNHCADTWGQQKEPHLSLEQDTRHTFIPDCLVLKAEHTNKLDFSVWSFTQALRNWNRWSDKAFSLVQMNQITNVYILWKTSFGHFRWSFILGSVPPYHSQLILHLLLRY